MIFSKGCLCCPDTLLEVASPSGRNRLLKLGRLDPLRLPEHRSSVFVILDQLGLVSDVFPISRFYYKIRLAPEASESALIRVLMLFNREMGKDGPLFHSISDSQTTKSLLFRSFAPPRPSGAVWVRAPVRRVEPSTRSP